MGLRPDVVREVGDSHAHFICPAQQPSHGAMRFPEGHAATHELVGQIGGQEPIVVEDTRQIFPIQYYDSGARYFRRLSQFVPLHLDYVQVGDSNQIERVLERAQQIKATAVAVRVFTNVESDALRAWLASSPEHRAILFHSGLYPFAQPLFTEFPQQVTFGDLHPKFE